MYSEQDLHEPSSKREADLAGLPVNCGVKVSTSMFKS
jgi:hypothetical protein